MPDYLLLMHDDAASTDGWDAYFARLQTAGVFRGGSEIGGGACVRRDGAPRAIAAQLTGFIRITADDLAQARTFVEDNPVYAGGGTVEIRELPRSE